MPLNRLYGADSESISSQVFDGGHFYLVEQLPQARESLECSRSQVAEVVKMVLEALEMQIIVGNPWKSSVFHRFSSFFE